MTKRNVAFVTYEGRSALTSDDVLAAKSLRETADIDVVAIPWDRPAVPWESFDAVVLRSTWDYFRRPKEFIDWLKDLERLRTRAFNAPTVAIWNAEKTYLRDLAATVPIVPTVWVERGEQVDLERVLRDANWKTAVIKPTISGTAYKTWVISHAQAGTDDIQARCKQMLDDGGMMIQPFLQEIVTGGEWSIVFFDGMYSHAVLKKPTAGDFRVQTDFGGSWQAMEPPPDIIESANRILHAAERVTGQGTPLYARVDGVVSGEDGGLVLMELELIEPVLFFAADVKAAPQRFARALVRRLSR